MFHWFLTGAHTNAIESAWRWVKDFLKRGRKIRSDQDLHEELMSYLWRKWHGADHPGGCYGRIIEDICDLYPLTNTNTNFYFTPFQTNYFVRCIIVKTALASHRITCHYRLAITLYNIIECITPIFLSGFLRACRTDTE